LNELDILPARIAAYTVDIGFIKSLLFFENQNAIGWKEVRKSHKAGRISEDYQTYGRIGRGRVKK